MRSLLVRDFARNLLSGLRLSLLMLRRLRVADFRVSPDQLVLLCALQLLLTLAIGMISIDSNGVFNPAGLSDEVFFIALLVLAGYLIARLHGEMQMALAVPIVALSVAPVFGVAYLSLAALAGENGNVLPYEFLYFAYLAWAFVVTIAGVLVVTGWRLPRTPISVALMVALAILPQWYFPASEIWVARANQFSEPAAVAVASEDVLSAQPRLLGGKLAELLPERPAIADLYFVGFAPYAAQDVFMKETRSVRELFDNRFDTAGRSIVLINNRATLTETPLAFATLLTRTLHEVAEIMDRENDILFLFITTHGSRSHVLEVEFAPLSLNQIDAGFLRTALDTAGIKWRVIAISACYSGGFVAPLKNDNTLIMTASDAARTSFGCGDDDDFTYFGRALFNEELRKTRSFSEAFKAARETIARWEKEQNIDQSNPQIHVGEAIAPKLKELEARLGSK